jgi:hypothetical protein
MKIALIISGQPRFVKECAASLINNIIDKNNVDVFAHLWFDEKLTNTPYKYEGNWTSQTISSDAVDSFKNLYHPKLIEIEESFLFQDELLNFEPSLKKYVDWKTPNAPDNMKNGTKGFSDLIKSNQISYFYSLNKANLLKKKFEYLHNFKYDWVVRSRTDTILHSPINFSNYNPNVVNYTNINNQETVTPGLICDWLNFGSSYVMDIFNSCFSCYNYLIEECKSTNNGSWCPELVHRKMIDLHQISAEGHPIPISLPRF